VNSPVDEGFFVSTTGTGWVTVVAGNMPIETLLSTTLGPVSPLHSLLLPGAFAGGRWETSP